MQKAVSFAAVALTILVIAAFTFFAVRGLLGPEAASARFGMPVTDAAGALFYRVYLSRNLVLVAAALVFLLRRQWSALATLMTVAIALPIFDSLVLHQQFGSAAPLTFHMATGVAVTLLSALLWLHSRYQRV